ncbi:MAG: AzlD domain-containing protein [Bacteroidales bacterium]|jgi:branched-subunit amino acid transport protein|nr:AzlD domain-containing protein [Bacteroidales bacterium]MDD4394598.1 AzlD domain-containing protein [Bacteroidales bacterium]
MSYLVICLIIMAGTTYLIRVAPIAFFQKKIENLWVQDFFYYIPFCVLAAMTFPDVIYSTTPSGDLSPHFLSAILAAQVALISAWKEKGLVLVAFLAVLTAIAVELVLKYMVSF